MVILLAIMLVLGARGEWSERKVLHKTSFNFVTSFLYTDPHTQINHVVHQALSSWVYMQVDKDFNVLHKEELKFKKLLRVYAISGAGDGKHLFMALHLDHGAFQRIDFTESTNGGKSWSSPNVVHPYTYEHRVIDRITYIKETGRLYLFYSISESKIDEHFLSVAYVTRPKDSHIFSKEVVLDRFHFPGLGVRIVNGEYTIRNNQVVLHVFFHKMQSRNWDLFYFRSTNGGAVWEPAKSLNKLSPKSLATSADSAVSDSVFALFDVDELHKVPKKLQAVRKHGDTFDKPIEATLDSRHYLSFSDAAQLCPGYLVTLAQTGNAEMEYSLWDIKTLKQNRLSHPFTDANVLYTKHLSCYVDPSNRKQLVVTALVAAAADENFLWIAKDTLPLP